MTGRKSLGIYLEITVARMVFPYYEECGEVFGDIFQIYFSWEKPTDNLPPKIHRICHFQNLKLFFIAKNFWDRFT